MGYCIRASVKKFTIKEVNKRPALSAIRSLKDDHFSWVDATAFKDVGTLEDMLKVWRWYPKTDPETGDVISLSFTGEKLGDDDVLFKTLGPFVEEGSEIIFGGEDGDSWKYKFNGKEMLEVKSRLVWEDEV
jgi:hypothetical protein